MQVPLCLPCRFLSAGSSLSALQVPLCRFSCRFLSICSAGSSLQVPLRRFLPAGSSLQVSLCLPCRFLWGPAAVAAHRAGALLPRGPGGAAAAALARAQLLQASPPHDARRAALAAVVPAHAAGHDPAFLLPFAALVSRLQRSLVPGQGCI